MRVPHARGLVIDITVVLVSLASLESAGCQLFSTSPVATGIQLGAFLAGMQQVRTQVSETMTSADLMAQNRLRQADIALEQRIKQIDGVAKGNIQLAGAEQERMFENIFQTLAEVGHTLETTPREGFIALNATLANIASIADGLPFVRIQASVFVADPVVKDPDAADRQISFYGYFPNVRDGDAVVTIAGRSFPLNKYPGKLAFDLDAEYLKNDRQFIEMVVRLPKSGWFSSSPTYHHRVFLRARKPFDIVLTSYHTHPDLWHEVTPPEQFKRSCNAHSNDGQETAANIYVELKGDTTTYDQSSAQVVASDTRLSTPTSKPCGCCPDPSASYTISADFGVLSWRLSAPGCGYKPSGCPGILDSCGGGGSNANVIGHVKFRVKKRGVPDEQALEERTFQLRRSDLAQVRLGTKWSQVKVVGSYLDGDYPVKLSAAVTSARPVEVNPYFSVKADPATGDVEVTTIRK